MTYGYEGHDADGHPRRGVIEAGTEEEAAEALRAGGVFAMRIEAGGPLEKTVLEHKAGSPPVVEEFFGWDKACSPKKGNMNPPATTPMPEVPVKLYPPPPEAGRAPEPLAPATADELREIQEQLSRAHMDPNMQLPLSVELPLPSKHLKKGLAAFADTVECARGMGIPAEVLEKASTLLLKDVLAAEWRRRMEPDEKRGKAGKGKRR